MVYYINRGLILEQAIVKELNRYFAALHLDRVFPNFHVIITNQHPFETLYFGSNLNVADTFPAIVVTTASDRKTPELTNMITQATAIGLNVDDFNILISEEEKNKAGICTLIDDVSQEQILQYFEKKEILYGFRLPQRKQDSISVEIWSENNQLKNEIYEHTRLFLNTTLINFLNTEYPNYDISLNENSITGQRSNNFNMDFDVPLSGAQLTLDIDYCIEQLVLDTELSEINNELIWEVHNHVKRNS